MRTVTVLAVLAVLVLVVAPAPAVDRDSEDEMAAAIELMQARQRIAAEEYLAAETLLRAANERTPEDPDVHSLLGFCARKQGRLDESYAHYQRALRLDPNHLGASEYLGELYLQRGEPDLARAQLAELDRLCPQGCDEQAELAEAIAAFEAAR